MLPFIYLVHSLGALRNLSASLCLPTCPPHFPPPEAFDQTEVDSVHAWADYRSLPQCPRSLSLVAG